MPYGVPHKCTKYWVTDEHAYGVSHIEAYCLPHGGSYECSHSIPIVAA
jgi:hypothetical protein